MTTQYNYYQVFWVEKIANNYMATIAADSEEEACAIAEGYFGDDGYLIGLSKECEEIYAVRKLEEN